MNNEAKVMIVMGSDSDLPIMEEAAKALKEFGVSYRITVASAHRSPERALKLSKEARDNGIEVIIAGAGAAAHLAGVLAAKTTLPVIGVPIDATPLNGLDALLSTVQMPGGIPVASMAIGKAGAKNAGIFAAEILSIKYPEVADSLAQFREDMAKKVEEKAGKVEQV